MKRRSLLALGLACAWVLSAAGRAEETTVPEHAKDLLGCWKKEQSETYFILFEATRCKLLVEGQLQIFPVKYEAGKVILKSFGQKMEAGVEVKDGVLVMSGQEQTSFQRQKEVPEGMELKPLPLGAPKAIGMARLRTIQEELAERLKADQAVRTDPTREAEMQRIDAENTGYLRKLVADIGWIDVPRFGAESSQAAFLIVQHSGELPLMLAALPCIEKDVRAKRVDGQPYALLYDRLKLYQGEKQRYGTQIGRDATGAPAVLPLEDKAKVEEFRREIGIFPLSQYLALFKEQSGGKDVKFLEE